MVRIWMEGEVRALYPLCGIRDRFKRLSKSASQSREIQLMGSALVMLGGQDCAAVADVLTNRRWVPEAV